MKGYTKPRVKVFEYHVDGEKHPEIVHAQYQDITKEYARAAEEIIREYSLQPDNIDIDRAFLVCCGDHGQGAFRVVFRALLRTLTAGPILYNEKCIAEVYCAKEEGILLDESVMPWLETDLPKIRDSQLK